MRLLHCLLTAALLVAQRPTRPDPPHPVWEVKSLFPHERSPARYSQVQQHEIDRLAVEGWELVAVMPYVYLNEERGKDGAKLGVTQTYPAYFFKRLKPAPR